MISGRKINGIFVKPDTMLPGLYMQIMFTYKGNTSEGSIK